LVTNEIACFRHCFRRKTNIKIINLFGIFACAVVRQLLYCYSVYGEKKPDYAEDADLCELCGSVPPHPVRCPDLDIESLRKSTKLCITYDKFCIHFTDTAHLN